MDDATAILPDDPAALKAMVASLGAQIKSFKSTLSTRQLIIETLQLQLAALRRQTFGRKSEKLDAQIEQLELKLEEFLADEAEDPAPATEAVKAARTKRVRKPLPEHLPRDTVTDPAPPVIARTAAARCNRSVKTSPSNSNSSRRAFGSSAMCARSSAVRIATPWCRRQHHRVQSSAALPGLGYWPMYWLRNTAIICRYTGKARFMHAKAWS